MSEHENQSLESLLEAPALKAPAEGSSAVLSATAAPAALPPRHGDGSPWVLDVDRWGKRRGEELAEQWDDMDENSDRYPSTLASDAHHALFDPAPAFCEHPAQAGRAEWFRQLMDTDEYRRLHGQTCLDNAVSEIAAKGLADRWLAFAEEHADQDGFQGPGYPAPGSDQESLSTTLARIRSTRQALSEAHETVQTARDLSHGLGAGSDGDKLDQQVIARYFQDVRNDDFLRRLMAMAGRMRRLCQALQRTKTHHGRDDMVGVELGGDVSRLLPSELAALTSGNADLELLALDRVARRQALCRQYRGLETLGRGPIVVAVDESGSMSGEPIIAAKGMALALTWLAKQQRRWIALVGYAGGTEGTRIAFPPGGVDHAALLEWLRHFYGGGTKLDVPLESLPFTYWPEFLAQGMARGRTDVVLLTDAIVRCSDEMRARYERWAEAEQVRTYGVVIGQDEPGVLADICTRAWCIPELSLDSEATETILSI